MNEMHIDFELEYEKPILLRYTILLHASYM